MNQPACTHCPHDRGGSDYDQAYRFDRKPTSARPFPFTLHQLAKLTLLRLRLRPEGPIAAEADRAAAAGD